MSSLIFAGRPAERHAACAARWPGGIESIVIHPTNIQYLIGPGSTNSVLLFPLDPAAPNGVQMPGWPGRVQGSLACRPRLRLGGRRPRRSIAAPRHGQASYLKRASGPSALLSGRGGPRSCARCSQRRRRHSLIERLKFVKSPAEIAYIRKAAAIVEKAMHVGLELIREGTAECELAGAIYGSLLNQGGDSPASPMNIVSGERACYPHGAPTDRRMRKGDAVNVLERLFVHLL
jgi:hypothetical protein